MTRRLGTFTALLLALLVPAAAAAADSSGLQPDAGKPLAQAIQKIAEPGQQTATAFLMALSRGDIKGGYGMFAESLGKKVAFEKFKATVEPLVKSGMKEIVWQNAKVSTTALGYSSNLGFYANRTTAKLAGVVKTVGAGLVDITVDLVKAGDAWQVEGLNFKSRPGTVPQPVAAAGA